ncbi:beta-glucosidase [Subsaxibacter sp. CAU 1640]|uniref:glucoamylase family protein n=1 Tax=Subsaxibacter sp. CAU 1640 TaxID=2933271 RepID=UPI0020031C17|nr:glucoamylase family protein [Subsaxibacter sp. CAU 1640]MCK7590685.1 beta-glucosidase [Subsaxibacter sp. CAU 1640]
MKKIFCLLFISILAYTCSSDSNEQPNNPDPTDDSPEPTDDSPDPVQALTDEEIMDLTQQETFKYFWNYAQTQSGAARERYLPANPTQDQNVVATGGSGFGLMAILVGIERGYITRAEAVARLQTILNFFENADRFRGAWPHWINGTNGNVIPFSAQDDGGDLVETALFAQGLICVKEYFKTGSVEEVALANQADMLWKSVEWDWYTNGQNKLLWHWSPNNGFAINLELKGYNETMIAFILGAASPDYSIPSEAYHEGWASNGGIVSGANPYGIPIVLRHSGNPTYGGPLFFSHYSFLGLDPTTLSDQYGNYMNAARNHSRINYQYCVQNPQNHTDYGQNCWGLTASYTRNADGSLGYTAHSPSNDTGVISPTAAVSSIPYTPQESLAAMHFFYQKNLMGPAGFYDAFSPRYSYWVANAYLAIDQGPQIIMIENHRTRLLWNLFMQNEDVQNGLDALGFTY